MEYTKRLVNKAIAPDKLNKIIDVFEAAGLPSRIYQSSPMSFWRK